MSPLVTVCSSIYVMSTLEILALLAAPLPEVTKRMGEAYLFKVSILFLIASAFFVSSFMLALEFSAESLIALSVAQFQKLQSEILIFCAPSDLLLRFMPTAMPVNSQSVMLILPFAFE